MPDAPAVPVLTDLPDDTVAVVHDVRAEEADDFEPRGQHRIVSDGLPLRAAGLRITSAGEALEVVRLRDSWNGWPSRPRDRVAFRLRRGEWGRVLRNNRHGHWHGWMYTKTVVNVAHLDVFDSDVFVASQPAHQLDEQASLR